MLRHMISGLEWNIISQTDKIYTLESVKSGIKKTVLIEDVKKKYFEYSQGYEELMTHLKEGEVNAISRTTLCSLLNTTDRHLRKLIEIAQLDGVPIISIRKGYFVAKNFEELRSYLIREKTRAESIERKINRLNYSDWWK